jgi:hypothetical protein
MTALIAMLVMLAIPFLAVTALLVLAERLEDRRELTLHRQIELTDAIHWELGAVAAPVVRRRLSGDWLVSMTVSLDRPALVASILQVTERYFAASPAAERFEIVLTPDRSTVRPRAAQPPARTQVATDRPLAA